MDFNSYIKEKTYGHDKWGEFELYTILPVSIFSTYPVEHVWINMSINYAP